MFICFSEGFGKDFKGRIYVEFLLMRGFFEEGEIMIVGEEEEVFEVFGKREGLEGKRFEECA